MMKCTTRTLKDKHDAWCAWCFEYIDREDVDEHHMYAQRHTNKNAELALILGWTVPAHKKGCHRDKLDPVANASGCNVNNAIAVGNELERRSHMAFYSGHLNLNIAYLVSLAHKAEKDCEWDHLAETVAKATISAAGTMSGIHIVKMLNMLWCKAVQERAPMPHNDVARCLGLGNLARNYARFRDAEKYYDAANQFINRLVSNTAKKDAEAALNRRRVMVCGNLRFAKKAHDCAVEVGDVYGIRTSFHNYGWKYLGSHEPGKAKDQFTEMYGASPERVSWWHFMAGHFGWGISLYLDNPAKYQEALGHCLRAQYVSAMLGLRCDIPKDVTSVFPGPDQILTPSAVIDVIIAKHKVRREQMTHIRKIHPGEGLRNKLLEELRTL